MLNSQKYNIKKNHKNYKKNIYEMCFKNKVFFCKIIVDFNYEN